MSEEFKIEIVNPEKSFLSKEDVTEVVVPAFEGEMIQTCWGSQNLLKGIL